MSEVLSKFSCDHIPEGDSCGLVVTLVEQNAKLRELVRDYERCTMHADCFMCEYDGKLSTHCPFSPCFPDADELCELGAEVDE
jgi:hypothetical protein